MRIDIIEHKTRDDASLSVAERIANALEYPANSPATFFTSGGTTPSQALEILSDLEVDWRGTIVGLVDERWTSSESDGSNERLVRSKLLKGAAGAAGFLPLKTDALSASDAARERSLAYAPHCEEIDALLLGMGNDFHTASWFPKSDGLKEAMYPYSTEFVAYINAKNSPLAGPHFERLTLTAPAICGAKNAILLLFGEDKLSAFRAAMEMDPFDAPIRLAVDALRDRLTVIWAP